MLVYVKNKIAHYILLKISVPAKLAQININVADNEQTWTFLRLPTCYKWHIYETRTAERVAVCVSSCYVMSTIKPFPSQLKAAENLTSAPILFK